jgi:hypothetical protein
VVVVSSKTGCGINQLRKEVLFLVNNLKPKTFYEQVEQEKAEKHAKYLKNNK